MPKHVVTPGEGVSSIADAYGFFPLTLWNHPENARLKAEREDPNILAPGDVVFIPDKRVRQEDVATDDVHRFVKRGTPALLRLQVFVAGAPQREQDYELRIDGVIRRGRTDADAVLEETVPPAAKLAILEIGPARTRFEIRIGHVDPLDLQRGVQHRLGNLGFACGDEASTRAAIAAFQRRCGLPETGDFRDPQLLAALRRYHDEREPLPAAGTSGRFWRDEPL